MKTTSAAVTLGALVVVVAVATFLVTSEDDPPPSPVASTTTTVASPTEADLATSIADGLMQGLDAPLTPPQATCVARAFLDVLGADATLDLVGIPTPLGAVSVVQRSEIVRGIVACVPPDLAAALLEPTTGVSLAPVVP